jgi:hypothetical protein
MADQPTNIAPGATQPVVVQGQPLQQAPAQKTKSYRLRVGAKHTQNGERVNDGQVVQLTDAQAKAFADKFESVDNPPAPAPEPDPTFARPAAPTPGLPQDQSAKTADPNAPQTNPGSLMPGPAGNTKVQI